MSEVIRNGSTCLLVLMLAPVILADTPSESKSSESEKPPTELSVAPLDHIIYPDDRPSWVGRSVDFDRDSDSIVVVSGPCDSREESLEELKMMQRAAVSTYIGQLTGSGLYDFYPISDEEIDRDLVVQRYRGKVTQGDMSQFEDAVELIFTEQKRNEIKAAWKNVEVRERLGALGVLGFFGTALLVCSSMLVGMLSRRIDRREQIQAQ